MQTFKELDTYFPVLYYKAAKDIPGDRFNAILT